MPLTAHHSSGKLQASRRLTKDFEFENAWNTLVSSFREIHAKNSSRLSFEELYRHAYRIVLKKKGDVLYQRTLQFEYTWLVDHVRGLLLDLTTATACELSAVAANMVDGEIRETRCSIIKGRELLKVLSTTWNDHQLCVRMISDILTYLDRAYCLLENRPSVYDAAMLLFRDSILLWSFGEGKDEVYLIEIVVKVVLEEIQSQRDGEPINEEFIKSVTEMMHSLMDLNGRSLYLSMFQPIYLEASREYYRKESELSIQSMQAGPFLRRAWQRLCEETERCSSILLPCTEDDICKIVEDEYICTKLSRVIDMESGLGYMVEGRENGRELRLLYELNVRVDEQVRLLAEALQRHAEELGDKINMEIVNQIKSAREETSWGYASMLHTEAALRWVDLVLRLKDKFDRVWRDYFKSNAYLQAGLTKAFSRFINCGTLGRAAEYISLFINESMRRGIRGMSEEEVDEVLGKAVILLRYVNDKDTLERYYKKHLSKRLLFGKSLSLDVEREMVGRMKTELGNAFTMKMESMFKDMNVSRELMVAFKEYSKRRRRCERAVNALKSGICDTGREGKMKAISEPASIDHVDFNVQVLTTTIWPYELDYENFKECKFPEPIEGLKRGFEGFYAEKHSGRRLFWQTTLGTAEVRVHFYANFDTNERSRNINNLRGNENDEVDDLIEEEDYRARSGRIQRHKCGKREKVYDLTVSTGLMILLMQFNEGEGNTEKFARRKKWFTFEELREGTGLGDEELVKNLQSISTPGSKTQLLVKEPSTREITRHDRFCVNDNFYSRHARLKIGTGGPTVGSRYANNNIEDGRDVDDLYNGDNSTGGSAGASVRDEISCQSQETASYLRVEDEAERHDMEKRLKSAREFNMEAMIVRLMKERRILYHEELVDLIRDRLKIQFIANEEMIKERIEALMDREYLERVMDMEAGTANPTNKGRFVYKYLP